MYKIPRKEYREKWEFLASEVPASILNAMGGTFDTSIAAERTNVNLDANMHTNMPEETKEEMPQVETDREAMKDAILNADVTDNTMTGHPVGGNEEPAAVQEGQREDPETSGDNEGMAALEDGDSNDTEAHSAKVPPGAAKIPPGSDEGSSETNQ
jgi:hypothetical protein